MRNVNVNKTIFLNFDEPWKLEKRNGLYPQELDIFLIDVWTKKRKIAIAFKTASKIQSVNKILGEREDTSESGTNTYQECPIVDCRDLLDSTIRNDTSTRKNTESLEKTAGLLRHKNNHKNIGKQVYDLLEKENHTAKDREQKEQKEDNEGSKENSTQRIKGYQKNTVLKSNKRKN
ncbi:hypothetical protein FQA39_LY15502 [Lamprigera yunnana]|nr:hypothetical protein FQA39_LY15502 [Lamprigera yunnana]